ncbi:MAG: hypothetical protein J1G38_01195 [Clostridiales bacterium]|nr:hypothetical protein [Clostridiales bacterium]
MSNNENDNQSESYEYRKRAEEERRKRVNAFADSLLEGSASNFKPASKGTTEPDIGELIAGLKEVIGREDHSGHRKRLRERLKHADLDNVPSEVLLETFLSYFIPRKDVAPLSKMLLEHYGSLWNVLTAPPAELKAFPSMTERASRMASHLIRLTNYQRRAAFAIKSGDRALRFFAALNAGDDCVQTHVAYLDADYNVIAIETHSGEKAVAPKTIVGGAYRLSASYVIIGRRESALFPQWQGGAKYAAILREVLGAVDTSLLDIIVFTGLGYYSIGASAMRKDEPIVYAFTPLVAVPDVGDVVRELTPDE